MARPLPSSDSRLLRRPAPPAAYTWITSIGQEHQQPCFDARLVTVKCGSELGSTPSIMSVLAGRLLFISRKTEALAFLSKARATGKITRSNPRSCLTRPNLLD